MVSVEKLNLDSKAKVKEFINFHYRLYKGTPQWVPPILSDVQLMLDKQKHPFYEHSDGDFFVARRGSEVVGRIAVFENRPFNKYHDVRKAQLYFFDSVEDQEVANCLFEAVFDYCRKHNLDTVVGPKGLSAFDGYGVQVEGFEHRQMMTMMNYNFSYYPRLFDAAGFQKEVDFVSCYLSKDKFNLNEKIHEVSRRVQERGKFRIINFQNKKELLAYAKRIGEAYNKTFVNNWEYYPLSEREIKFVIDNLMVVAVPQLIKIITYDEKVVGFILGFPDISAALQRHGGNVSMWRPWALLDILNELKKTKFISLNGAGVLPEYQGRGGNALMYSEMEKTIKDMGFDEGELTQVAETAVQMRKELLQAGGLPWKNHRIYNHAV